MSAPLFDTPFVIWTLQRTGGTNLNKHLNMHSGNEKYQDEPFNRRRECGAVTQAWLDDQNEDALHRSINVICAKRKNMKHCVERIPWPISEALIAASHRAGYAPVFLFREDPMQRLLSMEYAMRTKAWGPKKASENSEDPSAFDKPLDVDALIAHETRANNKLKKAWRQLKKAGAAPVAVSYEELYSSDPEEMRTATKRVFKRLGVPALDEKVIEGIRKTGDQQTRDRYSNFKGRDELQSRLVELPRLPFARQKAGVEPTE
ncbi:MAG: hypothetical protein AAFM92_12905 [Pseudomonadota bacterium]